jgi:hypothetical protein
MANLRALVLTAGGKTQEAADADTLIVSGTIQNATGGLTLNAAATSMAMQVGGTSYLTITAAAVTAANGAVFTGSGAGLTNIPASALPAKAPQVTGLTLWGTPVAGEIGYQTATAGTLAKAQANAEGTTGALGYYDGVAGAVTLLCDDIPASLFFESGLNGGATGAPAAGQDVFLSSGTSGRATNNAPTSSGHQVLNLGTIKDPTGYDNTNGSRLEIWPRVGQAIARA